LTILLFAQGLPRPFSLVPDGVSSSTRLWKPQDETLCVSSK